MITINGKSIPLSALPSTLNHALISLLAGIDPLIAKVSYRTPKDGLDFKKDLRSVRSVIALAGTVFEVTELVRAPKYKYAVGSLVELRNGVRLYVARQGEFVGDKPIYSLSWYTYAIGACIPQVFYEDALTLVPGEGCRDV